MSSTLTSSDMIQGRSSTRRHQQPGGNSTFSFNGEVLPPPPPSQAVAAPPSAPVVSMPKVNGASAVELKAQSGLRIGVAAAESPLSGSVTAAIAKTGSTAVVFNVSDVLSLPYAVASLLHGSKGEPAVDAVIVLGEYLESSSWASKEIANALTSSLLTVSNTLCKPVIIGLNFSHLDPSTVSTSATRYVNAASILIGGSAVSDALSQSKDAAAALIPSAEIDSIIDVLRAALVRHGAQGIFGLARKFKISDSNHSGTLDKGEVANALKSLRLDWTPAQLDLVFDFFDRDGNGEISYTEFLVGVRGPMPAKRMQLVLTAFGIMDSDKNGVLDARDLRSRYDTSRHPDVMSGAKDRDEVLAEFLSTFDVIDRDGKITPAEWIEYYSMLSASIDRDDYFELMMRNAWHLSGGEGWAANTSCRRVLVTHADGKQTVEEIKNDLGMKADDKPAMIENLRAQGITDVVSIDLFGNADNTSPPSAPAPQHITGSNASGNASGQSSTAASAKATPNGSPHRVRQAPGGTSNLVLG